MDDAEQLDESALEALTGAGRRRAGRSSACVPVRRVVADRPARAIAASRKSASTSSSCSPTPKKRPVNTWTSASKVQVGVSNFSPRIRSPIFTKAPRVGLADQPGCPRCNDRSHDRQPLSGEASKYGVQYAEETRIGDFRRRRGRGSRRLVMPGRSKAPTTGAPANEQAQPPPRPRGHLSRTVARQPSNSPVTRSRCRCRWSVTLSRSCVVLWPKRPEISLKATMAYRLRVPARLRRPSPPPRRQRAFRPALRRPRRPNRSRHRLKSLPPSQRRLQPLRPS